MTGERVAKRGRKEDNSSVPNRSRDVQRLFRKRQKDEKARIEARMKRLEEENAELRIRLGDPPREPTPDLEVSDAESTTKTTKTKNGVKSKESATSKLESPKDEDELEESEEEKAQPVKMETEITTRKNWMNMDNSVGIDGRRASMANASSASNASASPGPFRPSSSYHPSPIFNAPSPSIHHPSPSIYHPSPSVHSTTSNHSSPRLASLQSIQAPIESASPHFYDIKSTPFLSRMSTSSTPPSWPTLNTNVPPPLPSISKPFSIPPNYPLSRPAPPTIEEEEIFLINCCGIEEVHRGTSYELFCKTLLRGLEVTGKGICRRQTLSFEENRKKEGQSCCGGLVDCSTENFEFRGIPDGYLTVLHAWTLLAEIGKEFDGYALGTIILEAGEESENKSRLVSRNVLCDRNGLLVVGGVVDSVSDIVDLIKLKGRI